jgi:hypothetical protein
MDKLPYTEDVGQLSQGEMSMKRSILLVVVVLLLVVGWRISTRLSADAIGLATGVVFGVLAGLPAAVLVLASNRRKQDETDRALTNQRHGQYPYGGYPHQPPVIVLTNQAPPAPAMDQPEQGGLNNPMRALPPPVDEARQYRIIGEPGELDEEYV